MPWKPSDAEEHIKGLTDKQSEAWAKVANSVRTRCIKSGGTEKACDARAIMSANAAAKRIKEAKVSKEELMTRLEEVGRVVSAANAKKLKAAVAALEGVLAMDSQESERVTREVQSLIEAAKMEGGKSYPPEAYAYVEDPEKPATWKLRLWEDPTKKETSAQVGRAIAALSSEDSDQVVDIPDEDMVKVKARIRKAWKKVNPDKEDEDMPAHLKESDLSHNDTRQRLSTALKAKLGASGDDGPWVKDIFDDNLVYEFGGKTYRMGYSVGDNDAVTVKEPVEVAVKTVYEPVAPPPAPAPAPEPAPVSESEAILAGDVIPLDEKAVAADGALEVKIIKPGWGSSGFYSQAVLARDASVYVPGTKMYWDHPTESEDRERPERSLRDLAAELTTAGQFKDGVSGPGVYAQAKVFGPYKEAIEELAPHIGISHRALGKATRGEAEGKKGPIIEKIVAARSVDFVTTPGAGGEVVQLFEAARNRAHNITWESITIEGLEQHRPDLMEGIKTSEEAKRMSEEEFTELKETTEKLEGENTRLKESAVLREAHDLVAEKVGESDLPEITKTRLTETLAKSPVMKDGVLDKDEYVKHIEEAIKNESDYIAQITSPGGISGMGSSEGTGGKEKLHESFKAGFLREGLSEEEADRMAGIAVLGR